MPSHDNQPDQKRIVANLAEQSHMPARDVAELYEHERAEVAAGAHVSKFVHIFAIRNVQKILRERARPVAALTGGGSSKPLKPRDVKLAR